MSIKLKKKKNIVKETKVKGARPKSDFTTGERNLYTPADPNMRITKTGHDRSNRYTTAKTGTRDIVKIKHERWLKEKEKARAKLKKKKSIVKGAR